MANDETRTPRPGPDTEGYPGERPAADEEIVGSGRTESEGDFDAEDVDEEDFGDEKLDEEESEPE
jgi:hypothetical protein